MAMARRPFIRTRSGPDRGEDGKKGRGHGGGWGRVLWRNFINRSDAWKISRFISKFESFKVSKSQTKFHNFNISKFQNFKVPTFHVFGKSNLTKISFWDSEENIKVFWGGPGQNRRFWGSFLVHWNSKKHEDWGFSMFGKVNPAPAVSIWVRMVFWNPPGVPKTFENLCFSMLGKVNPAPAVSILLRLVVWSLLKHVKPPETNMNDSKNTY